MKYQSYLLIELITHSLMRNTFCFDTYGGCSNLCFWISLYLFRMTFLFRPMICLFVMFRHICQWYHGRLGEVNSIPWRVYSTSRTGSSDESLPIGLVGFKNPTETTAQWWLFQWNAWNLWKCLCFFLWKSMKFTKRHHGVCLGFFGGYS